GTHAAEPVAELGRRQHPAHEVGLPQYRREEVVTRRLVADRGVPVAEVEVTGAGRDRRPELVTRPARPIEREAERPLLAAPPRPGALRRPLAERAGRERLERGERLEPARRVRVLLPLPQ